MLTRRFAVGELHLQFSKNSVLCMNEFLKLVFSLAMCACKYEQNLFSHTVYVMRKSALMLLPAVVYLVVNLISYPSLERINASVFTAISQLKVCTCVISADSSLPPSFTTHMCFDSVWTMHGRCEWFVLSGLTCIRISLAKLGHSCHAPGPIDSTVFSDASGNQCQPTQMAYVDTHGLGSDSHQLGECS